MKIGKFLTLIAVGSAVTVSGAHADEVCGEPQVVVIPMNKSFEYSVPRQTGQTPTLPYTAKRKSDGFLQKGKKWPNPRFIDQGNGTVLDAVTNLVWLKKANCLNDTTTWGAALEYVDTQIWDNLSVSPDDKCGLSDGSKQGEWRVPNINELMSLVAWQYAMPALSNARGNSKCNNGNCVFTGVAYEGGTPYWSSTTDAKQAGGVKAWAVSFSGGGNTKLNKVTFGDEIKEQQHQAFVWPVRDR